ncbi:UNVERIFIED_CONTAM: hypothetical protein NY603_35630, partial [Bacteroidetes bacterium 56_B9]
VSHRVGEVVLARFPTVAPARVIAIAPQRVSSSRLQLTTLHCFTATQTFIAFCHQRPQQSSSHSE